MKNEKLFKTLKAGLGNGLICTFEMYTKPMDTNYDVTGILKGIDWQGRWHLRNSQTTNVETCNWGKEQPHLFPLSMLTKPIVVKGYNDGKEFVPVEFLENEYGCYYRYGDLEFDYYEIGSTDSPFSGFQVVEQLNQWHFNVFNLDEDQYINANESKVYEL